MSLSCSCDNEDWEPGTKLWFEPREYTVLATKRSRKCCSCGATVRPGETAAEVRRGKVPDCDIEVRIYGDEETVPLASRYLCEVCADLAFSLGELGYCSQPFEDQRELVEEYAESHTKI